MSLFVDISVWSLALRRDTPADHAAVETLRRALLDGDTVVITGIVLQELLQGFHGPKDQTRVIERLQVLPEASPDPATRRVTASGSSLPVGDALQSLPARTGFGIKASRFWNPPDRSRCAAIPSTTRGC